MGRDVAQRPDAGSVGPVRRRSPQVDEFDSGSLELLGEVAADVFDGVGVF